MKKIVWTIIAVLIVEVVMLLIVVFSGWYDISTSNHDNAFINWWFENGGERSVEHHAAGIKAPPLDNPAIVQEGFKHYDGMCSGCHGAPGKPPSEISKGFWPDPPDLARTVPEWTPEEVFWITKNGMKFSAMPAWGPTHSDDKLWAITAFLEKLPHMSGADYQRMREEAK
jgi:mono/diheme cytochrome c family protein